MQRRGLEKEQTRKEGETEVMVSGIEWGQVEKDIGISRGGDKIPRGGVEREARIMPSTGHRLCKRYRLNYMGGRNRSLGGIYGAVGESLVV